MAPRYVSFYCQALFSLRTPVQKVARLKLRIFFDAVLGHTNEGYICFARRSRSSQVFEEDYFFYPRDINKIEEYINRFAHSSDLWFCPQFLKSKKRRKDNVDSCPSAWADLDACTPDVIRVPPSVVVESSPNRYQAYWSFNEAIEPVLAEDVSRRIAYAHEDDGCDTSGWDLTQLLRVPTTFNFKYGDIDPPEVKVFTANGLRYDLEEFANYAEVESHDTLDEPLPTVVPDADKVLFLYRNEINPIAQGFIYNEPTGSWSEVLWQLELMLFEAGLNKTEVFSICSMAHCNKYERDHRGPDALWKEICKAHSHFDEKHHTFSAAKEAKVAPLLTDEEREWAKQQDSFVDRYISWAKTLGDAAPQYHQAGAFVCLSAILSGMVRLKTSFGEVKPNLWFLILADTTLTRKTTAMDIAMELLQDVDPDAMLATDGSIEGLFTALSTRPGRPSVFLRDEFSGLIEVMAKKEYMAGTGEALTKLYDGKYQKRILRKETIELRDPVVILFGGGIKSRLFEILNPDMVTSGFLPRFIFVTAEADLTRLRPVGPPTTFSQDRRDELRNELIAMRAHYQDNTQINVGGKVSINQERIWQAELTDEAWLEYNRYETTMLQATLESPVREILTPTMDRLAKSGLKAAILLAASRMDESGVTVTKEDITHAFYYVEQWRNWALEVVSNIGSTTYEKQIDMIYKQVTRDPNGVPRSIVMRNHKLSSRNADDIISTMVQRGMITQVKNGKSELLRVNT